MNWDNVGHLVELLPSIHEALDSILSMGLCNCDGTVFKEVVEEKSKVNLSFIGSSRSAWATGVIVKKEKKGRKG